MKELIKHVVEGNDLNQEQAVQAMEMIMTGESTPVQTAGFIAALRMKGETIDEITGFVQAMREKATKIPCKSQDLVDTCGTGGDSSGTFNVSTISAIVAAGAGCKVAKHGNRSVTSKSGSADVLEKLGVNLNTTPNVVESSIEEVGIGFMFAPTFHKAMKHVIGPRREIGIRTVFNVLGPLTNPANASAQLLGVYDRALIEPLAGVLKKLGCEEAMVVHGLDGLDEISTIGKTAIAWLKEEEISLLEVVPKDFGIEKTRQEDLRGTTPEKSAEITFKILTDQHKRGDPKRDIVLANAAAGILLGGKGSDFCYSAELARESIKSGAAYKKLKMLIEVGNGDKAKLEEMENKYG